MNIFTHICVHFLSVFSFSLTVDFNVERYNASSHRRSCGRVYSVASCKYMQIRLDSNLFSSMELFSSIHGESEREKERNERRTKIDTTKKSVILLSIHNLDKNKT